jgi:hypothetical protein
MNENQSICHPLLPQALTTRELITQAELSDVDNWTPIQKELLSRLIALAYPTTQV